MATTRDTAHAAGPIERAAAVPETLDGWTLDAIRALLVHGVFESDRFDFKVALPHANDERGKRRLRAAAAAFANSSGGFLIIGIHDDRGMPAEERVAGVPDRVDVPERFGTLASEIEPSIDWHHKNPPLRNAADRLVHVIHIPSSRRGPHGILEDERWMFPKRTNRGIEQMSRDELRAAFVDLKQRAAVARMLDREIDRIGRHAEAMNRDGYRSEGGVMPPTLYLEHYRIGALERALPFVMEEVLEDYAVHCFQELLAAANASDLLATQIAARIAGGGLHEDEVDGASWMMRTYAQRVMNNVHYFRERSRLSRTLG